VRPRPTFALIFMPSLEVVLKVLGRANATERLKRTLNRLADNHLKISESDLSSSK
jgi:hypothetical protein